MPSRSVDPPPRGLVQQRRRNVVLMMIVVMLTGCCLSVGGGIPQTRLSVITGLLVLLESVICVTLGPLSYRRAVCLVCKRTDDAL
ncbi:hypothetical protein J3F83DRAFT_740777 [Trichoderma novae-zelandiae]